VMEGHLPDAILYRKKMGFVTPISAWFRGPLANVAEHVVSKSKLAESGWFDRDVLSRIFTDHRSGLSDNGRLLWQLVMLDKSMDHLFG
jgi:asparagine synthase (glutamine-hydrolysing)